MYSKQAGLGSGLAKGFSGIRKGVNNLPHPVIGAGLGLASAPYLQQGAGIESDAGRTLQLVGNIGMGAYLGSRGWNKKFNPEMKWYNPKRLMSPIAAIQATGYAALPTSVAMISDHGRYAIEKLQESIEKNPDFFNPDTRLKAIEDSIARRAEERIRKYIAAQKEESTLAAGERFIEDKANKFLAVQPQPTKPGETPKGFWDTLREHYENKALGLWNEQDTAGTRGNDIKKYIKGMEQGVVKNVGLETGAISGGLLGGSVGALGGSTLADLLFPSLPTADYKHLDEKGFRQRYKKERNRERYRSLAKLIGSLAGSGIGGTLGVKYMPGLIEKIHGSAPAAAEAPAVKTAAYRHKLRVALYHIKAAEDTGDIRVRMLKNLIGRPLLGAGLGYGANRLSEAVAPSLGINTDFLTPEEKKHKRSLAMLTGALYGMGKGTLSEVDARTNYGLTV